MEITGFTAERMLEIEEGSVVGGEVVGDDLILTKHDGSTINAGNVRGPVGPGLGSADYFHNVQQGVFQPSDGALTRTDATHITIAAGIGWVKLASGLLQSVTWVSTALVVRNPVNSALDQVVVDQDGHVSIQQGTDVAGVTLDNRTGANDAGIDAGKLRLWDLNVTNVNGGLAIGNFRDRRPWARGARAQIVRTANASAGDDYTTSSGSYSLIDSTNLNPRLELTGVPVKITLNCCVGSGSAGGHAVAVKDSVASGPWSALDVKGIYLYSTDIISAVNASGGGNRRRFVWTGSNPPAGSHKLAPIFAYDGGSQLLIAANAGAPLVFTIEEIVNPFNQNLAP